MLDCTADESLPHRRLGATVIPRLSKFLPAILQVGMSAKRHVRPATPRPSHNCQSQYGQCRIAIVLFPCLIARVASMLCPTSSVQQKANATHTLYTIVMADGAMLEVRFRSHRGCSAHSPLVSLCARSSECHWPCSSNFWSPRNLPRPGHTIPVLPDVREGMVKRVPMS